MKKRSLAFPLSLTVGLIVSLLSFTGCEKPEERELGKDVLSEEERMESIVEDSFKIETRSVKMPSVPAEKSDPAMFGKLRDERTGRTRAAFYSQLLLPGTNIDLGKPNDLTLDSVVLSLRYKGFYGDTSAVQEFRVHQVIEDMEGIDPEHRDTLDRSSTPIGTAQRNPKVGQKITVDGGSKTLPPHFRIRLNDNFGKNILDRSGKAELSDNSSFTDFINGISISSYTSSLQDGEGAVLHGKVPDDNSKVTLYYRNTAQNDTGRLELKLGGVYYNHVRNRTSGSQMASQLDSAFSPTRTKSYVLGPGEVATQIRFPTLSSLDDSVNISVNKAELKLSAQVPNTPFSPAAGFFVLYKDASGDLSLTKDRTLEGGQYVGGGYEEKEKRYRFRITRHIQGIINGNVSSNAIYVTTNIPFLSEGEAKTVARSVIKGPGSSDPPELELTYTEY